MRDISNLCSFKMALMSFLENSMVKKNGGNVLKSEDIARLKSPRDGKVLTAQSRLLPATNDVNAERYIGSCELVQSTFLITCLCTETQSGF